MLKKISLLLFISLSFNVAAQGAILLTPSLTYMDQKVEDENNNETKRNLTIIDLRLGYVFDFGLYIGGLYSIHDRNIATDASDSYFGPSLGYYNSGFLAVATFYVYGERDLTNGDGKFTDLSGYQLDFSYSIPVAEDFSIGPQLTYHTVKFGDLQTSGFSNSVDYTFSGITPYFNMTFFFK